MPTNKQPKTSTGPVTKSATTNKASSESTTLLKLPKEILYEIIKTIGVEDIGEDLKAVTRFAITSKQSLIFAEAAVGSLKELRSLEKRFGKPEFEVSCVKFALSKREDFKTMFPKISSESPAPDLAYLNLNGSLSWLPPLDPHSDSETLDEIGTCFREPLITARELNELIAQAERLHLKFPPSFLTLVRSEDLQRRIPSFDDKYFSIGSLIKCPRFVDRNAGGYVLRFLLDKEDWTSSLYLDTMGQHCVFFSIRDIDEHAEQAEESDEDDDWLEAWAGDIIWQALDFEEFMYHTWIDQMCWGTLLYTSKISEAQRVYLEHMQRP